MDNIVKRATTDEKCCGACQYMLYEDIDGTGQCELLKVFVHCSDVCDKFKTFKKSQK